VFWQYRRVPIGWLIGLAILGLFIILILEMTEKEVKREYFNDKLKASKTMKTAMSIIKNARIGEHFDIDAVSDPNKTGLIGEEFTLLTTDQGDLDSKLTTTNPNFAALFVELLRKAGVENGDYVAVAWTGSFPAANIALMSALSVIGAKPIIITSLGSSMWGANNPEFTWLDMEKLLYDYRIFHFRSIASSIGGRTDNGGNISPQGRELAREEITRHGIELIETETLSRSIDQRMQIYKKALPSGKEYKAYINIGGGMASLGSLQNLVLIPEGLTLSIPTQNYPRRGTMVLFGEQGTPVINIFNVLELAPKYDLPISPEPLPEPPSGGIYFRAQYNLYAVSITLFIYIALLIFVLKRK
jgi:poly-gamma-glutamate system protein